MKSITIAKRIVYLISICFASVNLMGQNGFSVDEFDAYLKAHQNMDYQNIQELYPIQNQYLKGISTSTPNKKYLYFDSIQAKYGLTPNEIDLIGQNQFMVTERLMYSDFGNALYSIFQKDLPVMVTTDAILHALHMSYDAILKDLEKSFLTQNLDTLLAKLYDGIPTLATKYASEPRLMKSLHDVDLYIAVARTLLHDADYLPQLQSVEGFNMIKSDIDDYAVYEGNIFSDKPAFYDFSQFKVRGHYDDTEPFISGTNISLTTYFKAMMWLGRIQFELTKPDEMLDSSLIKANGSAIMLNELMSMTDAKKYLTKNNNTIDFLVGKSDNLTPDQYQDLLLDLGITSATAVLDSVTFSKLNAALNENPQYGQKILSDIIMCDPSSAEPTPLPVVFKLMGQRFCVDSYVFSNVVYDKINYNGQKIFRPMPDPLDALFAMGNKNTLPLLQPEIDQYHYASQLANITYLVSQYTPEFWESSLYNNWLSAIRTLNDAPNGENSPLFTRSAAWQQQKMNTQLASWSQLRHDNLLYAKPSYTGGTTCSYPHSYVEPYPDFFTTLKNYALTANEFFTELEVRPYSLSQVTYFFKNMAQHMETLAQIASKELAGEAFSESDNKYLSEMLFEGFGCGPPFNGWYSTLFYAQDDAIKTDYIIADIHTQPTDEPGNMVGNVFHAGTGPINLGVFLAKSPSSNFAPMAYVGPVMSYYDTITSDFFRYTDAEWGSLLLSQKYPIRPDWVNIYLADKNGNKRSAGRELPAVSYVDINEQPMNGQQFRNANIYPNPARSEFSVAFDLTAASSVKAEWIDASGRIIKTEKHTNLTLGTNHLTYKTEPFNRGVYLLKLSTDTESVTLKVIIEKP